MKHINLKNTEDRGRKGDFAEFYAVTWLWDKGYEVFKNCGSTGIIDLIAIKDGVMLANDAAGNPVLQSDGLAVAMSIVFGG